VAVIDKPVKSSDFFRAARIRPARGGSPSETNFAPQDPVSFPISSCTILGSLAFLFERQERRTSAVLDSRHRGLKFTHFTG
jgi:hypothetical protein